MHHPVKLERFYLSQNVTQFSKKEPRIFKLLVSSVERKYLNSQEFADLNPHPWWENAIHILAWISLGLSPSLYQEYSQFLHGHKR